MKHIDVINSKNSIPKTLNMGDVPVEKSLKKSQPRSKSKICKFTSTNPYVNFLTEFRSVPENNNSRHTFEQAVKRWKQLTMEQKEPYITAANENKANRKVSFKTSKINSNKKISKNNFKTKSYRTKNLPTPKAKTLKAKVFRRKGTPPSLAYGGKKNRFSNKKISKNNIKTKSYRTKNLLTPKANTLKAKVFTRKGTPPSLAYGGKKNRFKVNVTCSICGHKHGSPICKLKGKKLGKQVRTRYPSSSLYSVRSISSGGTETTLTKGQVSDPRSRTESFLSKPYFSSTSTF